MRWNFLTIAFRQARRHKEQAIIKILGLAVGIAVCVMIFLVIRFETSFDDFHPKVHRIVEDNVLSLVRQDAMAGHMADICFVPIKLDLAATHPSRSIVPLV